jgi:hypothetical protein
VIATLFCALGCGISALFSLNSETTDVSDVALIVSYRRQNIKDSVGAALGPVPATGLCVSIVPS